MAANTMKRRSDRTPSQRQLKVGEEVRHALARVLERGDMRDPGLQHMTLTVTEVKMSPDLRQARVFVTPLGGGEMAPVVEALSRARPFLRREVARVVRLKYVPDLVFLADETFENARRIDALLRDPRVSSDLAGGQDEADIVLGEPEDGI